MKHLYVAVLMLILGSMSAQAYVVVCDTFIEYEEFIEYDTVEAHLSGTVERAIQGSFSRTKEGFDGIGFMTTTLSYEIGYTSVVPGLEFDIMDSFRCQTESFVECDGACVLHVVYDESCKMIDHVDQVIDLDEWDGFSEQQCYLLSIPALADEPYFLPGHVTDITLNENTDVQIIQDTLFDNRPIQGTYHSQVEDTFMIDDLSGGMIGGTYSITHPEFIVTVTPQPAYVSDQIRCQVEFNTTQQIRPHGTLVEMGFTYIQSTGAEQFAATTEWCIPREGGCYVDIPISTKDFVSDPLFDEVPFNEDDIVKCHAEIRYDQGITYSDSDEVTITEWTTGEMSFSPHWFVDQNISDPSSHNPLNDSFRISYSDVFKRPYTCRVAINTTGPMDIQYAIRPRVPQQLPLMEYEQYRNDLSLRDIKSSIQAPTPFKTYKKKCNPGICEITFTIEHVMAGEIIECLVWPENRGIEHAIKGELQIPTLTFHSYADDACAMHHAVQGEHFLVQHKDYVLRSKIVFDSNLIDVVDVDVPIRGSVYTQSLHYAQRPHTMPGVQMMPKRLVDTYPITALKQNFTTSIDDYQRTGRSILMIYKQGQERFTVTNPVSLALFPVSSTVRCALTINSKQMDERINTYAHHVGISKQSYTLVNQTKNHTTKLYILTEHNATPDAQIILNARRTFMENYNYFLAVSPLSRRLSDVNISGNPLFLSKGKNTNREYLHRVGRAIERIRKKEKVDIGVVIYANESLMNTKTDPAKQAPHYETHGWALGSKSFWGGVTYIHTVFIHRHASMSVLAHELGHALSVLPDSYVLHTFFGYPTTGQGWCVEQNMYYSRSVIENLTGGTGVHMYSCTEKHNAPRINIWSAIHPDDPFKGKSRNFFDQPRYYPLLNITSYTSGAPYSLGMIMYYDLMSNGFGTWINLDQYNLFAENLKDYFTGPKNWWKQ